MEHKNIENAEPSTKSDRRTDRFDVELPVEMDGVPGLTRNICATGIYFETETAQTPGSRVRFTVEVTVGGEKSKMVCEGEVIRVESKNGVVGVAVSLSSSFFANNGSTPATGAATGKKPKSAHVVNS